MALSVKDTRQAGDYIEITFEVTRWFRKPETHKAYGNIPKNTLFCETYHISHWEKVDLIIKANALTAKFNFQDSLKVFGES